MSIFASQTTETIPIPFDAPHTVTIQKLAGRDVDAAQLDHMAGVVTGRGRNWAVRFLELARAGAATEQGRAQGARRPAERVRPPDARETRRQGLDVHEGRRHAEVTAAAIEDLDDEALEFCARAVLQLTKPALFQTADEREADRKNG
jgi:hypothetical protein